MSWSSPIFDRTETDILNRTPKAFWNVADWVRIYDNAVYLVDMINIVYAQQLTVPWLHPPTLTVIPTAAEFSEFMDIVDVAKYQTITGGSFHTIVTEYAGGAGGFTPDYECINDLEENMLLMRDHIQAHLFYQISCGVPAVGQNHMWQVRFRTFQFVKDLDNPVRFHRCSWATCGATMTRNNRLRRY